MEYNKRNFKKTNNKKVLHKVRKHWVVVSMAILMAIGGKAALTHVNASANDLGDNYQKSQIDQNHTTSAEVLNQSSSANQQGISSSNPSLSANSLKPGQIVNRANELHQRILTNAGGNHSDNALNARNHGDLASNNSRTINDAYVIHQMDNNALNAKWAKITWGKLPQSQRTPQAFKHIKAVQHDRNVTAFHVAKHMLGNANNLNDGPSDQSKVTFRWYLVPNNSDIDNARIISNYTYRNEPGVPIADVIRSQEFDPMISQDYQAEGVHFDSDVKGTNHGLLFDSPYDGNKSINEPMPSSFPAGNHTIDVYLTKPQSSTILIEYDNMAANGQAIAAAEQTNEDYAGQPFKWSSDDANIPNNFQLDHVANAIPNSYPSGGTPYVIHVDVKPKDDTVNGTIEYVDSDTHQPIGTIPISGQNGSKIPSDVYSDDLKLLPNSAGDNYTFVGTSPANGQDYVNNEKLVAYVTKAKGHPITVHYMNNHQQIGKSYVINGPIGKRGELISNVDPVPTGYTLSPSDDSNAAAQYTITSKPQSDYINVVGKYETPTLRIDIHKEGISNGSDVENVRLSGRVGQRIDVHPSDYRPADYEEDTSNNRDQTVTTTITPNGALTPNSVDFYYIKPSNNQTGTITFNYINQNKVPVGTKTINGRSGQKYNSNQIGTPTGYKLNPDENNKTYVINSGNQTIPVYVNGNEFSANFTIRRETENNELIGKPITMPIVGAEVGNTVTIQPSSVKVPDGYTIDPKDSAVSVTISPGKITPTSATFYYLQNNKNKGTVTINYVNNGSIVKSYRLNGDVNGVSHKDVSKDDPIPAGFNLIKPEDREATFRYQSDPQTINVPIEGTLVNPTLTVNQRIHDYNGKSTVNLISKVLKNHHIGDRITIDPNQYLPGNQKPGTSPVYYVDPKTPKSTSLVVLSNGKLEQLSVNNQLVPGNVNYDYDETGPITVKYINSADKLVAQSKPYYGTYGSTVYSTDIMPIPEGYVNNGGNDAAIVSNRPQVIAEYVQGINRSDSLTVNVQVKSNGVIVPSRSKSITVPVSLPVGSDQIILPDDYRPSDTSDDSIDKPIPVVMEYNNATKQSYLNPGNVTFIYDEQAKSNHQSSNSASSAGSSAAAKSASSKASSSVRPDSGQTSQSSESASSASTYPQSSGSSQASTSSSNGSSNASTGSQSTSASTSITPISSGSQYQPGSNSVHSSGSSNSTSNPSGSSRSSNAVPASQSSSSASNKPANDNVTSYILFRNRNGNVIQTYSDTGNVGSVIDYPYYINLFNINHPLQNGYYIDSINNGDSKTLEPNRFNTITVSPVYNGSTSSSTYPQSGGSSQASTSSSNSSSVAPSSGQTSQSSNLPQSQSNSNSSSASNSSQSTNTSTSVTPISSGSQYQPASSNVQPSSSSNSSQSTSTNSTSNTSNVVPSNQSSNSSNNRPTNNDVTSYILFRDLNGNAVQIYSDTGNAGSTIDYPYYINLFNMNHPLQNGYYTYSVNANNSKTLEPNRFDTVTVSPVYSNSTESQSTNSDRVPASQASLPTSQSNASSYINHSTNQNTASGNSNVDSNSTVNHRNAEPASSAPDDDHQKSMNNTQASTNGTHPYSAPVTHHSEPSYSQNNEQAPIAGSNTNNEGHVDNVYNSAVSHDSSAMKNSSTLPQTGEHHSDTEQMGLILMALALSLGALDAFVADRRRRDNN